MPIYALHEASPTLPSPAMFWVAPDAHVIGAVTVGPGVGIWFGATIRGDRESIVLGEDTNVQEGAVLHTDMGFPMTIGRGCTIGHNAIIHGCTIGDNVLIGMGATVMNGAVIGANSLVGAGALVTEGKHFPDRSLIVGSPAKAIRTLDDAAVERLRDSARSYVANWTRFAAGLRRLD
jgi:carbonic anhydrase/acetyltransferase-like protein (isoleucine patch superfamily)